MKTSTFVAVLCSAGWIAGTAAAQDAIEYPTKSVQVIVAWSAGGGVDTIGRRLAQGLSDRFGQAFVVNNVTGASGMIGARMVASSPPDGYTLSFGPITSITTAAPMAERSQIELGQFEFICKVFDNVFAIIVPATSPYKSGKDLIAAAKREPGKITYGHLGAGSLSHMSMENVLRQQGLHMIGVPYRGDAAMIPDLLTNRVSFVVGAVSSYRGQNVRTLAMFNTTRIASDPEVPTTAELGLPTLLPALNGLMGPKGMPVPIVKKLESGCREVVASQQFQAAMKTLNQEPLFADRATFSDAAALDYNQKVQVIKNLGIKTQ